MDLVSVIVPVYGVEDYLERCVDSLLNQTYKNIQIILVDDGSPDRCPEICDAYAGEDNRVFVIHKCNGGLSDARNAGLAIADGEYISFVDSDDWVSPLFIESLMSIMKKHGSDIVDCGLVRTDGNVSESNQSIEVMDYTQEQALKLLIEDHVIHQHVWNKLYKREVIKDILFEKGKCNEDEFWTYQAFGNASRVSKTNCVLYYYFQRQDSIMGVGYSVKRLDAIEAKIERQRYLVNKFPSLVDVAGTNLMWSIIYSGQMCYKWLGKNEKRKSLKRLEVYILKIREEFIIEFIGSMYHHFWLITAQHNLKLVCVLRNMLRIGI